MRTILLSLIIFSLSLSSNLQAQLNFTNYSNQNNVNCLLEDGNYVWVGTSGGLMKRNKGTGSIVATYTTVNGLSNNNVKALATDASGKIWVGTDYGISVFNGSSWAYYTNVNEIGGVIVNDLKFDYNGKLWVTTLGQLSKFDGTSWTLYNGSNTGGVLQQYFYDIAVDEVNNIWFASWYGLIRFDGTNWQLFNSSNSSLVRDEILSLYFDNSNKLWVGYMPGMASGLSSFDGSTWNSYLLGTAVNNICGELNGQLWISSNNGLYYGTNGSWIQYQTSNSGLISNIVFDVLIDSQGRKWVGSPDGLCLYDNTSWMTLAVSNTIANNTINDIVDDANGNRWFCTEKGLSKLNSSNNWSKYTSENTGGNLNSNQVLSACKGQGNQLYFGTAQGVVKFDGSQLGIGT